MQCANRNRRSTVEQYLRAAEANLANGSPRAALADLDLAFLASPDDAVVRFLRGRALSKLGRAEAALRELNAAIGLDPSLADAWLERSTIRLDWSDWATAEIDATRALELDPDMPRAWRTRGIARYRMGFLPDAAKDLRACLSREPDDPSAHYWRGLALRDAGENHAALSEFDSAIRLNERYAEAYVARGKTHSNLGDMTAARSDWTIAAQMLHHSH